MRRGRSRPRRERGASDTSREDGDTSEIVLSCGHLKNDLREDCAVCMEHYEDLEPTVSQGDGGGDANATPGASSSHEAFAHAAALDRPRRARDGVVVRDAFEPVHVHLLGRVEGEVPRGRRKAQG